MRKFNSLIIICFLLTLVIQTRCSGSKECIDDPCVWIELNDNGYIIEKYVNYCDSNMTDSVYYFYDNGSIKKTVEYRKGLEWHIDGWVAFYDSLNGNKTLQEFYVEGKPIKSVVFYTNGVIRAVGEIFNKKRAGNVYYYDSIGRFHSYVCYDFEGFFTYRKEYPKDQDAKITFQQDEMISQYWFTDHNMKNAEPMDMVVDSNYLYHVVIPNPPDRNRIIYVSLSTDKGEQLIRTKITDTTGVITYPIHFYKPGNYLLTIMCELIDPISKIIEKNDSLSHKLRVEYYGLTLQHLNKILSRSASTPASTSKLGGIVLITLKKRSTGMPHPSLPTSDYAVFFTPCNLSSCEHDLKITK